MNGSEVFEIAQGGIITLLWVTGPIMGVALGIGLLIALFQALTSIQEVTLTFVPKIIVVFIALIFFMPLMGNQLTVFTENLYGKITESGKE